MTHRFRSLAAAAALVTLSGTLAACNNLTEYDPQTNRYGSINIVAKSTSPTEANATASAVFFEAVSAAVPNSASQATNACVPDVIREFEDGEGFSAGPPLSLVVGSNTIALTYDSTSSRYETPRGTPSFSYTAGQSAQITVPGNSEYPSSNISVKLAEPILPGPAVTPALNQPFIVTWNATNDPTTAVLLSLRYGNATNATTANEQVFCSMIDDGRFEMPYDFLTRYLQSPVATRSLKLTRFRTNELLVDARTVLHVASTTDTTIAVQ